MRFDVETCCVVVSCYCFAEKSNARTVSRMLVNRVLTPTTAFIRAWLCVCYSYDNSKTNDPKVLKVGIGNDLGISYKWYGFGVKRSKVRVTGSQSAKTYSRRSSGRREFAPLSSAYRRHRLVYSVFLSRVSTLTRDNDIAILSVRPSVCLSVRNTLVLYENGLTYRHSFSPYGIPIIFTCVSYAEARNRYRLDVRLSDGLSVRPSFRHTLAPYQNGWIYCHAFFTTR